MSAFPDDRPSSGGDRKKWEAGIPLILPVAHQTLEETCVNTIGKCVLLVKLRALLQKIVSALLCKCMLSQCMCIITDQTAGEVIQMGELQAEGLRKVWEASPECQVLRALQEAELQPLTQNLETGSSSENEFSSVPGLFNMLFISHTLNH